MSELPRCPACDEVLHYEPLFPEGDPIRETGAPIGQATHALCLNPKCEGPFRSFTLGSGRTVTAEDVRKREYE